MLTILVFEIKEGKTHKKYIKAIKKLINNSGGKYKEKS
jgi:uncharacterized protein (DUF1330 family)